MACVRVFRLVYTSFWIYICLRISLVLLSYYYRIKRPDIRTSNYIHHKNVSFGSSYIEQAIHVHYNCYLAMKCNCIPQQCDSNKYIYCLTKHNYFSEDLLVRTTPHICEDPLHAFPSEWQSTVKQLKFMYQNLYTVI